MTLTGVAAISESIDPARLATPAAVDPVRHPGWDALIAAQAQSTVFHSAGWARVLCDTYGHTPLYLCRFAGAELTGMLPLMEVSSPLTGRRGVSLPFTDFCDALPSRGELYAAAMELGRQRRWKYLECRGRSEDWAGATPSLSFYGHVIDLAAAPEELFNRMESALRRGIRKAEKAGVKVDFASSLESVQTYYHLHCRTRRHHGLPPQPWRFFENIQRCVLGAGLGFVATARLKDQPLAAAIFFTHGRRAIYKFGASDYGFQSLRPNNLMMWEAMRQAASQGCLSLHMGRTSLSNKGLRHFKLAFGAKEETVQYCRYDFTGKKFVQSADLAQSWVNHIFARMPLGALRLAGRLLYPHLT